MEIEGAEGGRRGVGSANHCMHGPDAVIEEILDWRPYDYVTDRTVVETPDGPVGLLHTIEFEPTSEGTVIEYRFAPPDDPSLRETAGHIGDIYGAALRSSVPMLQAQLEEELEKRLALQTSD